MNEDSFRRAFSRNLKFYLAREGKTQADMVKYLKISSATASDWCNERKIPRADKLQSICNWLGITLTQLTDLTNPYTRPAEMPDTDTIKLASQIMRSKTCLETVERIVALDGKDLEVVSLIVERLSR